MPIRRWRGQQVINVIDRGAAGDTHSDNTKILNAVFAEAIHTGAEVYFPKGNYKITAPLVWADSTPRITGAGRHTIITATGADFDWLTVGSGAADGSGPVGYVQNIRLAGSPNATPAGSSAGFKLDGCEFTEIRNVWVDVPIATYGVFGVTNAEGLTVVFTSGGESPTIPVTREEYLRAQIFTLEGKNQEKVKDFLEFTSKTQYERWKERAVQRKKDIDDMVAGVAQVDPAKAAKVRADLENADRLAGETHKKNEAAERAELDRMKAKATAAGDSMRARIAAMTPAERASPAYAMGHAFDVVPAGTPNANAIVRVDPEFYRTRRTPVEPRIIMVHIRNDEYIPELHRQMFRELDWAAIKRLLTNTP